MPSNKMLMGLSLLGSLSLLFIILGCVLNTQPDAFGNKGSPTWWPLFVIAPLLMTPLPLAIVRCSGNSHSFDSSESSNGVDFAYFFTGIFLTVSFFIPAAMADYGAINSASCALVSIGGVCSLFTLGLYFRTTDDDGF